MAIHEAKKAYKKDEIPVGAIIVKNGKISCKKNCAFAPDTSHNYHHSICFSSSDANRGLF